MLSTGKGTSNIDTATCASTSVGKRTIDAFPVASKKSMHPQNLKKENMRKWKTVSKQVNQTVSQAT